jgi:hypothetical protein
MAVRTVNNRIVSRIDLDATTTDNPFRSIVSDGEEAVVFNPSTEEVAHRIPMEDPQSPLYRMFGGQNGLSRINLSLIREEAKRLSLNIAEDAKENTMALELPAAMLSKDGEGNITRSRVVFDTANEILVETEVVMVRADETVVTTTSTPVYETVDGVPVKIGMVTVIDSKTPYLIEGFDPDTPFYNSIDDIPTLSEEDFAAMRETGNIHEVPGMTFGDPSDLSYVVTIYEVYRDIEINTAPESLFRLIRK